MFDSPIDEIKSKIDIVELVGSYIKLQKAGQNYRALCPFHSEKKPSFFVSPSRQIWKCFGCGRGGDIFKFIMEIEGVDFKEALKILADRAGVQLKPVNLKEKTERLRILEILELATEFFQTQLEKTKKGNLVKKYLKERGILEKSIEKWRLGYAPNEWDSLSNFLINKGYKIEEIIKSGLAIKKEENKIENSLKNGNIPVYDRFRGRIIFPIFDLTSKVIGFGGRILPSEEQKEVAKYVNTPNTIVYDKSKILYGLDKAKSDIIKKKSCIIVEGYTDTILLHQAGFENSVACSGTALTNFQLKLLSRYTENLLICFDMDSAGELATQRGINLAHQYGFNIKIITLPEKMDPADVILKNPKLFEKSISEAKNIFDYYFDFAFSKYDPETIEGKREITKFLLPKIKSLKSAVEKDHWIRILSDKLLVSVESLYQDLKNTKIQTEYLPETLNNDEVEKESIFQKKDKKQLLQERAISLLLQLKSENKILEDITEVFNQETFSLFLKENQEIIKFILGLSKKIDPALKEKMDILALESEVFPENFPKQELKECIFRLKDINIREKMNNLSQQIKLAKKQNKNKELEKLLKNFTKLSNELSKITKFLIKINKSY